MVGGDGGIFVFSLFLYCVFIPVVGGKQTLNGQTLLQEQKGKSQHPSGVDFLPLIILNVEMEPVRGVLVMSRLYPRCIVRLMRPLTFKCYE